MEDEECIEDLEKKKIIIMVGEKSPSCGTKDPNPNPNRIMV